MISESKPITGWHIATLFILAFSVIISVNLLLAFKAVSTFPGLEVKNSYVASQQFDKMRTSQEALNWDVSAEIVDERLVLTILSENLPISARITKALFGRATHTGQDQLLDFNFDGQSYSAPVQAGVGNWNLRLTAVAQDGTEFQQRVVIRGTK
jgi:nitrogen fixation protein FixH